MSEDLSISLLHAAVKAAQNAYARYSGFVVGAALRTADGSVFIGANMENASYGLTMCAEVGALTAATVAGKLAEVVEMAIVGGKQLGQYRRVGNMISFGKSAPQSFVTPCGRCRQLIFESAQLSNRDIEVLCANLDLDVQMRFRISELLPYGFGPANLDAPLASETAGYSPATPLLMREFGAKQTP